MVERADKLYGVQVVKVDGAIETASHEQAHLVVYEDGGDLTIVVV